jgi:DNA repair photolyase
MKAPELLREKMMSKSWKPEPVFMSGITDCYQPIERKLELTRKCLEVFNEFNNPVFIVTKNHLVTRDIDILSEMAKKRLISVTLSVTTLDVELARKLEPRTSSPPKRLEAIQMLSEAGIPTSVNVAPTIPGLTDYEMPKILKAAADAGAKRAGYVVLRLPYSVKDIFVEWVRSNYPEKADKVINYIREMRGGKLYDANFETRMIGVGEKAESIAHVFHVFTRKYGLNQERTGLTRELFKRPSDQLELL